MNLSNKQIEWLKHISEWGCDRGWCCGEKGNYEGTPCPFSWEGNQCIAYTNTDGDWEPIKRQARELLYQQGVSVMKDEMETEEVKAAQEAQAAWDAARQAVKVAEEALEAAEEAVKVAEEALEAAEDALGEAQETCEEAQETCEEAQETCEEAQETCEEAQAKEFKAWQALMVPREEARRSGGGGEQNAGN